MSTGLKVLLSMSFSGSLLILALLLGKQLWKDRLSRQWQYYIWLVALLRLLLPFGPETSLLGGAYQAADRAIPQALPVSQQRTPDIPGNEGFPAGPEQNGEEGSGPAKDGTEVRSLQGVSALLSGHIGQVWLAVALGLLLRKITAYQSFIRYVRAGSTPVSDVKLLDQLSVIAEREGIKKPIELGIDPLISSPLLIGSFHPCIVLPSVAISEKDFSCTVLHELTHYKRLDMLYKWLVQLTVCLHWFNPLVYLMSGEITKACEFSCDEAVLSKMGRDKARDYGETLLNAMAAVGKYRESFGAVTLSANKRLLKERIGAIMNFKKRSTAIRVLTGMLTLWVMFGAVFVGVYPAAAAKLPNSEAGEKSTPPQTSQLTEMETLNIKGTTYYLVQNEVQLRAIGTGKYGMEQNYMQQADIQLSSDEWTPIGTWENPFTGTFTGNGFEIKGLTMTDPNAMIIGLFGVAKNAHIYNVTLRDYDITNAGRNATGKSVGAILAIGQGSRSYDNLVYPKETAVSMEDNSSEMDQYDKAGSLPLFEITFSRLEESAQREWLERLYGDGDFAFFSVAVRNLDTNSPLLAGLAEKAYSDEEIAFFSAVADRMGQGELELWLDRALEDGKWDFQSMLFDRLDKDDAFDGMKEEKEKEWAEGQTAEYRAVGVTMDGEDYSYRGQLVNIFLDIRANGAFYTLNVDPKGTVNIRVLRDGEDKITGVAYMTEAEAAQLLEDRNGDD